MQRGFGAIIVMVVVGIMLSMMMGGFFVLKNRFTETEKQDNTQLKQETAPMPNPTLKSVKTTKEYKSTNYHFIYPATWSVTKNVTTDGHTSLVVKDPGNAQATMLIQETAGKAYEIMVKGMQHMGYSESSVMIDKITVKKFTNIRPADLQTQFETIFILTSKDKTYLCKLSYTAGSRNSSLEREYVALIESIKFL